MVANGKYKIIKLTEINSTNLHASALLSGKLINSPAIILAGFQHHGKGQAGNTWESEAGMNILMSIIQFPKNIKASEQFYISKITSLVVKETIKELAIDSLVKWPNDIMAGNEKIAGILIENTLESDYIRDSVIGVGINVNQVNFKPYSLKATSLKKLTGHDISLQKVIDNFIKRFDYWYDIMEDEDFNLIDREYLTNLYGFQRILTFRNRGQIFEARIIDVEKDGSLVLLMNNNKKQKFVNKELEYIF